MIRIEGFSVLCLELVRSVYSFPVANFGNYATELSSQHPLRRHLSFVALYAENEVSCRHILKNGTSI
jgi:hypothetical protein